MALISSFNATEHVVGSLRVKVTIERSFWFRMKLSALLIRAIAWVCPLTIELVDASEGDRAKPV